MKTALDIYIDFSGSKIVTSGKAPVYTCTVTIANGERIIGYGSTLESAEDTAWHGVAIATR